jgi:aspartate/methionine/tyrosine aminotransferase
MSFLCHFQINEKEALDLLAKQFNVLVMLGSPFGAPGYLRISYGNIQNTDAINRLRSGINYLCLLSKERISSKSTNKL